VISSRPLARHLRPRGDGIEQPITTVELFFDLVYVFAITQLSHMILGDLTVVGVGRAAFLLLIVWWAWIYTTWMANWFDPASPAVRAVLTGVMLASLLMAAALPGAFGAHGVLFAVSYVVLQVGRCATSSSASSAGARCPACSGSWARPFPATGGCCCGSRPSCSTSAPRWPATGCRAEAAP
jgi:low temperature requirement protein LtrA